MCECWIFQMPFMQLRPPKLKKVCEMRMSLSGRPMKERPSKKEERKRRGKKGKEKRQTLRLRGKGQKRRQGFLLASIKRGSLRQLPLVLSRSSLALFRIFQRLMNLLQFTRTAINRWFFIKESLYRAKDLHLEGKSALRFIKILKRGMALFLVGRTITRTVWRRCHSLRQ